MEILGTVLDVMEIEKLLESGATVELVPQNVPILLPLSDKREHTSDAQYVRPNQN